MTEDSTIKQNRLGDYLAGKGGSLELTDEVKAQVKSIYNELYNKELEGEVDMAICHAMQEDFQLNYLYSDKALDLLTRKAYHSAVKHIYEPIAHTNPTRERVEALKVLGDIINKSGGK